MILKNGQKVMNIDETRQFFLNEAYFISNVMLIRKHVDKKHVEEMVSNLV